MKMKLIIPMATAGWAILTWAADRKQERNREHARISALYVNPFLSACEDLQSRLYSILELDGLQTLRARYPDESFAEETLYLIVRYFGWDVAVQRHGQYTRNPVVMHLSSAVRSSFSMSSSPRQVGPFNFFSPEQKALGKLVMTTKEEGQYGVEPDTISYYEFKRLLRSPPLSESVTLQQTLEALRHANNVEDLPGHDRLAVVQNHLVDLISYIEGKEGYTLFQGKREKCRIATPLTVVAGAESLSAPPTESNFPQQPPHLVETEPRSN